MAGGFDKCLDRITDIGGNCLQTFASSPRSLQTRDFTPAQIEAYNIKKERLGLGPHFFHGVYLVDLASPKADYLSASIDSLVFYQKLAGEINAIGTVFHLGNHHGRGFTDSLNQIVASVNFILDSSPKGIRLILENAAGQAGSIGATFQELAEIIGRVGDKSKIGVCLDTQHAWASGIPLDRALDQFDKIIGLKRLTVIHCNDSKSDLASHVDRHENLGEGKIGSEALKNFLNDPRIATIPVILEVPGPDGSGPGKDDIDTLKSLLT